MEEMGKQECCQGCQGEHRANLGRLPHCHGLGEGAVGKEGVDAAVGQTQRLEEGVDVEKVRGRRKGEEPQGDEGVDKAHETARGHLPEDNLLGYAEHGPDQGRGQAHKDARACAGCGVYQIAKALVEEEGDPQEEHRDAHDLDAVHGLVQEEDRTQHEQHGTCLGDDLAGRGREIDDGTVVEHKVAAKAGCGNKDEQKRPLSVVGACGNQMAEGRVVAEKVHQGQEEASFRPVGQDKPHPQGNGCEAQPDDGENVDARDDLFQGNGQGAPEDDCGQGQTGTSEFCWKHACSREYSICPGGMAGLQLFVKRGKSGFVHLCTAKEKSPDKDISGTDPLRLCYVLRLLLSLRILPAQDRR